MNKVLIISPHPDDETLGCGGSIFSHNKNGDEVYIIFVTSISINDGWSAKKVNERNKEINKIKKIYNFKKSYNFEFPTSKIKYDNINDIINKISNIFREVKPNIIYTPFINDIHTDHQIISKSVNSCLKKFRYKFLKKALYYEVLSETNLNFSADVNFHPNVYINITPFLNKKIQAMKIYRSEIKKHPFPRSEESIKALATLRGSESGFKYAEAFQLLFEYN